MNPISLSIDRFRSFREPQEFAFPAAPGLYFMSGDNRAEPRLDANGAGKSTVWEALAWCLFNRTSRGLKAGDVCSWGAGKGTRVTFAFEAPTGEGAVGVTRQWGPVRHYAQHEGGPSREDLSKGQDFVLGWLGLTGDQFLQCVLMAQGQPMFLDLKPEPRSSLFAGVLGLDAWVERSARAGRMAADEDGRLRRFERELAAAEATVRAVASAEGPERAADRWERERAERMDEIDRQHEQTLEHSYAKEDLDAAVRDEDAAFDAMRAAALPENAEARLDEVRDALRKAERDYAVTEDRWRREADRLARVSRGGYCDACGQTLDGPGHRQHLRDTVEEAERLVEVERRSLSEARSVVAECAAEMETRRRAWEGLRDAAAVARDATGKARAALDAENRELRRLEDEHARLKAQENPHREAARRAQQALEDAQQALADARRHKDASERRHSLLALWVRGFKEVRLQEMSDALSELEIEVNSACAALGLVGWDIRFSVDRETKSGAVSRGFAATVSSPGGGERVPWEAWSGGESQRLRLAAQMGLADMIRSRTRCPLPLEVWDEPTQGLSGQGTQDLLDALADRARIEGRQVWVVDHRAHSFGGFSGGALVVKERAGSRIEQW